MATRAQDLTLTLHIGLHKTASSYVQNLWAARREELGAAGVLFPSTGLAPQPTVATRAGAQSGHTLFTRRGDRAGLVTDLVREVPATISNVLLSAEDFTLPRRMTAEQFLGPFEAFGSVRVVLVLRRQDAWVESVYKQTVDQFKTYETRPFGAFLAEEGQILLDFHTRFSPWREIVGPENFHVISYDDMAGGAAISHEILRIAGLRTPLPPAATDHSVPGYESIRAIDTVGLRMLNGYRLADRGLRNQAARRIYGLAPESTDLVLMTEEMRAGVMQYCAPINQRIEAEWCSAPVPGFRFGRPPAPAGSAEPTPEEMVEYLDRVIAVCEDVRRLEAQESPASRSAADPDGAATSVADLSGGQTLATAHGARALGRRLRPRRVAGRLRREARRILRPGP